MHDHDDNAGFVDHQPHHDDGAHIVDDDVPVIDYPKYIRDLVDDDKFVPFDDLRRDFVDALAHYWATDGTSATTRAAATKLAAALRHPSRNR